MVWRTPRTWVIDEGLPLMEVHISNPSARDEFRKRSVISGGHRYHHRHGILWLQAGNRSGCALVGRTLTSTFRHGFSRMPVFKASGFFVPMRTTHIPVSPDWYTVILQTYANREHGEVTKRSMTMGAIARRITRVITAVVCVAVSVGVSVATLHVPTREGGGERFNPARYRSDVIVTMFQANWKSVARECGEVLGPEGVGYVQVSPPQESIKARSGGRAISR